MSGKLRATLVMLQPLRGDDVAAALGALGPAINELDRAAYDAGFRLQLIVKRDERANESGGEQVRTGSKAWFFV